MTSPELYLRRVRQLLFSVAEVLSVAEQAEVAHLVDHGEPAEGLRTLAWILVEENKRVPASVIAEIRALTLNWFSESDLPDNLEACALDMPPNANPPSEGL
jgi:hypothetical protein